jgi:histidinol-phosphatase
VASAVADDLQLALELCDAADRITAAAFRRPDLAVETKPDLSPVTEADRAVELALREELSRRRPGDSVLGEEFGEGPGALGRGSARRWIVDPIDGTKNFVRGIPVWATLLALEEDGTLTVGAVSAPALGRRWWAGRGIGAYAGVPRAGGGGGVRIQVSRVSSLSDAQVSGASLSGWEERGGPAGAVALALRCWRDRAFGDFWSHMLVAEGACEIALDPVVSLWDLAAVQVIVEEAGGRFTDLTGVARADGGSAVSSNGLLHGEALAILQGDGA